MQKLVRRSAAGHSKSAPFLSLALLLVVSLIAGGCGKPPEDNPEHLVLTASQARPLTDWQVESTPERIARGKYLAEGVLRCMTCHSPRHWSEPGAPAIAGQEGIGAIRIEEGERRIVAPNLTPDKKTGIGRWTDDMLARAIREGVGHDGRVLSTTMEYQSFRRLSDDDLAAVISFLRSCKPVRNELPPTRMPLDEQERLASELRPLTAPVARRDTTTLERGRYLMIVADCEGCHTAWDADRNPGLLAGGNTFKPRDGGPTIFSTNITPHSTGVAYDDVTFRNVIRTGMAGTLTPEMPWISFRKMNDEDLAAISQFLRTMQPVRHAISNRVEPTWCVVCEQEHGLGETNQIERPAGVPVDIRLLDDYIGAYTSSEYGFTIRVTREGNELRAQEDDGPVAELIAQSADRFRMLGGLAPLRFVRNESGDVIGLISEEVEPLLFDREG